MAWAALTCSMVVSLTFSAVVTMSSCGLGFARAFFGLGFDIVPRANVLTRLHRFPTTVLLRIGCVPIPARLFWLEARGHLSWPMQLYVRFGVNGPCLTAFVGAHHSRLHGRCQAKHRHACPFDSFNGRRPSILVLCEIVLNLRSATGTRVFQESLASYNSCTDWNGRSRTVIWIKHRRPWFHVYPVQRRHGRVG